MRVNGGEIQRVAQGKCFLNLTRQLLLPDIGQKGMVVDKQRGAVLGPVIDNILSSIYE